MQTMYRIKQQKIAAAQQPRNTSGSVVSAGRATSSSITAGEVGSGENWSSPYGLSFSGMVRLVEPVISSILAPLVGVVPSSPSADMAESKVRVKCSVSSGILSATASIYIV